MYALNHLTQHSYVRPGCDHPGPQKSTCLQQFTIFIPKSRLESEFRTCALENKKLPFEGSPFAMAPICKARQRI